MDSSLTTGSDPTQQYTEGFTSRNFCALIYNPDAQHLRLLCAWGGDSTKDKLSEPASLESQTRVSGS